MTSVVVARVAKPHGLSGEVALELTTDRLERFEPGAILRAGGREFVVASSRPHKGRMLVRFADVTDRTAAERLRGIELEADALGPAEAGDTYLASELVGMRVLAADGRELGRVGAVVELPPAAAYDLLEVRRADGSTWLLPATEEYVAADEGAPGEDVLVVTDPPAGLIDGGEVAP